MKAFWLTETSRCLQIFVSTDFTPNIVTKKIFRECSRTKSTLIMPILIIIQSLEIFSAHQYHFIFHLKGPFSLALILSPTRMKGVHWACIYVKQRVLPDQLHGPVLTKGLQLMEMEYTGVRMILEIYLRCFKCILKRTISFNPIFNCPLEDLPFKYSLILESCDEEVRFEASWFRYECISLDPVLLKGPNADAIKKPTVCAIFQ